MQKIHIEPECVSHKNGDNFLRDRKTGDVYAFYRQLKNKDRTWLVQVKKANGQYHTSRLDPNLPDYEVLAFIQSHLELRGVTWRN